MEQKKEEKKYPFRTLITILSVIIIVSGILAVILIPQFNTYCCGAPDSDSKSNLHNIFLACKAHWADNGSEAICTNEVVAQTSYGYIQSDEIKIFVFGNEENFKAYVTNTQDEREKVFELDSQGSVQESTGSVKVNWPKTYLNSEKYAGHLRDFLKACKAYWKEAGLIHDCPVDVVTSYEFEPPPDM